MPIYEYICETCGKQSELLIRSKNDIPTCECGSTKMKQRLSTFAVAEGGRRSNSGCETGQCGLPSSPCASGMCGLN